MLMFGCVYQSTRYECVYVGCYLLWCIRHHIDKDDHVFTFEKQIGRFHGEHKVDQ